MRLNKQKYQPYISDKYALQSVGLRRTYLIVSALFNVMFFLGLDRKVIVDPAQYQTTIALRCIIIFGHLIAAAMLYTPSSKRYTQLLFFYAVLNQALCFEFITLLYPLDSNLHAVYFSHLLVTMSMAPLLLEMNLLFAILLPVSVFIIYLTKSLVDFKSGTIDLFINFNLLLILAGFYTAILRMYLQKLAVANRKQKRQTEREKIKLERAHYNLITLDAFKTQVLSVISHDIRTPLLNIQGLMKLKKEMNKTDDLDEQIINSTDAVLDFINNVLNWSASQIQGNFVNVSTFNVLELVEGLFRIYRNNANAKHNKLENLIPSDLIIETDRNILQLVLKNLISNAIKFTSDGVITVGLEENETGFEIFVRDTGIGIDQKRIQSIFDRNTARSIPGTNKETGTGLGLILANEYLSGVGGELYVTSEPGYGSTFYVHIPHSLEKENKKGELSLTLNAD